MQKNIWIAAKYLRLSIEDGDKAESESIVNQSILIDNYMKSTSDITIVETFKDDGFSGTDFKRPGFQAMLKAIENKEINCIIVKDLFRNSSIWSSCCINVCVSKEFSFKYSIALRMASVILLYIFKESITS